jgi:CubicO group peptidase (beta-lactamase class C family)
MLLGRIIEKLSGQSYVEFCRTQLFGPLGIVATFGYSGAVVPNRAHTYTTLNWTPTGVTRLQQVELQSNRVLPSMLWPAGGLDLDILDFAKWIMALQSGKVIRRADLELLWAPAKLNDGSTNDQGPSADWRAFGLGWGSSSGGGRTWVGFSGGTFATFRIYPSEDLDVVVLTNLAGSDPESLAQGIADRFFLNNKSP